MVPYRSTLLNLTMFLVALPDLVTDDAIHAFIYGLKPWLKGFVKAQA